MTTLAIPLPTFSSADPMIAGNGPLDPIGLAQGADFEKQFDIGVEHYIEVAETERHLLLIGPVHLLAPD